MAQPTKLTINRAALVEAAQQVRETAYAPYSGYRVGAALLAEDGAIYTGCNVENASYPATICAERAAVTKAISEGQRHFLAIAIATSNGGTPCGICRQVMYEFAPDLLIILAGKDGAMKEYRLSKLLPEGFGPQNLPGDNDGRRGAKHK